MSIHTTAINITKPESYDLLSARFTLVRYAVPLSVSSSQRRNEFGYFHNQMKEQINAPYYVFTYDALGTKWAVYVLYPRIELEATLPNVTIGNASLPSRRIEFSEIRLHILLKLLQIQYFRTEKDGESKFVGQNKSYIHARSQGKKNHICLDLELKGDLANVESSETHLFRIKDSACLFSPVSEKSIKEGYHNREAYFARTIRGELVFFSQIKPSQVQDFKRSLYEQRTFDGDRAKLDYHDNTDFEHTRGYLMHTFIADYAAHLRQYGFRVEAVSRDLEEHRPTADKYAKDLPISELKTIWVYDNRLNRSSHTLESYIGLFQQLVKAVEFKPLDVIPDHFMGVVLILLDCERDAFREGMPLHGKEEDPYPILYRRYPDVVKQSWNVNANDPADVKSVDYLQYPILIASDIATQLNVIVSQLFLKDIVVHEREVTTRLPFTTTPYIFARRDLRNESAMYFDAGKAHFLDLKDPIQKGVFYTLLERYSVDARYDELMDKKEPRRKGDKNARPEDYRMIVGPGLLVEIEDVDESILYEYDQIVERDAALNVPLPIEELKLWRFYDTIKTQAMPDYETLMLEGYVGRHGQIMPGIRLKKKSHQESLTLFNQLREYDMLLDEIGQQQDSISFTELTSHPIWMKKIAEIFARKPDAESEYKSGFLKDYYQRIDKFASTKSKKVIAAYQGIWSSSDGWYVIGAVNNFQFTQPRAHLLRKFVVHQGSAFDPKAMLDAMSVQFVRYKQYTVYPYYFNLLDLFDDHCRSGNQVPDETDELA